MSTKTIDRKHCWFSLNDVNHNEGQTFKAEDSQDEQGRFKFSGVAYSGKPIMNHPFWGNLIFDVSTMKSKSVVPIFRDHRPDREAGHGKLSFDDGSVKVEGFLYEEEGEKAYRLMKKGYPMQESVYIEPEKLETIRKGEVFVYNGQKVEGPMTIFVGGAIKEVSLVSLGADENTSTKIFNNNKKGSFEVPLSERESKMEKENNEKLVIEKEAKEFSEDYTGFLEAMNEGPEQAYEFACSCAEKKSESSEKKLKSRIKELEAKIAAFEAKEAESKKAAKEAKIEEAFKGSELPESVKSILISSSDEAFDALLSDMSSIASKKEPMKKEMFKEVVVEKTSLNVDDERRAFKDQLISEGKSIAQAHFLANKKFGK